MFKKIAIVADHRGEPYKEVVAKELEKLNVEYVMPMYNAGAENDYPDVFAEVYKLYKSGEVDGLILLCGTGVGMCMVANKYKGIRCVWANDINIAGLARSHENANALALATKYSHPETNFVVKPNISNMKKIIKTFLTTPYSGGRHERRVEKLNNL